MKPKFREATVEEEIAAGKKPGQPKEGGAVGPGLLGEWPMPVPESNNTEEGASQPVESEGGEI